MFESWMTEVCSRDMHRMTNIVDARWAAGSGIDVLLLTDPFVHALANRIPDLCPDMRPSKTSMREAVLECHVGENGPCLFHLGTACAVATQVAERIRKVCAKYRVIKEGNSSAESNMHTIWTRRTGTHTYGYI